MSQPRSQRSHPLSLSHWKKCPLAFLLVGVLHLGCSGSDDSEDASETTETEAKTFEAQVERGMVLYVQHCAHCHGDSGEGTDRGPLVVGEGRLPLDPPDERMFRDSQFVTALDVFVFANAAMPADNPDALTDAEMVDVLAFALFANGVSLDEPLSGENAESVVINED